MQEWKISAIRLERIFLDLSNPRHDVYRTEEETISYLCKHEKVYEMAEDIVSQDSLNPMDIFGVIPAHEENDGNYTVVEGNRRLCALILLADAESPPKK